MLLPLTFCHSPVRLRDLKPDIASQSDTTVNETCERDRIGRRIAKAIPGTGAGSTPAAGNLVQSLPYRMIQRHLRAAVQIRWGALSNTAAASEQIIVTARTEAQSRGGYNAARVLLSDYRERHYKGCAGCQATSWAKPDCVHDLLRSKIPLNRCVNPCRTSVR